jgi:hypothetical protein
VPEAEEDEVRVGVKEEEPDTEKVELPLPDMLPEGLVVCEAEGLQLKEKL